MDDHMMNYEKLINRSNGPDTDLCKYPPGKTTAAKTYGYDLMLMFTIFSPGGTLLINDHFLDYLFKPNREQEDFILSH